MFHSFVPGTFERKIVVNVWRWWWLKLSQNNNLCQLPFLLSLLLSLVTGAQKRGGGRGEMREREKRERGGGNKIVYSTECIKFSYELCGQQFFFRVFLYIFFLLFFIIAFLFFKFLSHFYILKHVFALFWFVLKQSRHVLGCQFAFLYRVSSDHCQFVLFLSLSHAFPPVLVQFMHVCCFFWVSNLCPGMIFIFVLTVSRPPQHPEECSNHNNNNKTTATTITTTAANTNKCIGAFASRLNYDEEYNLWTIPGISIEHSTKTTKLCRHSTIPSQYFVLHWKIDSRLIETLLRQALSFPLLSFYLRFHFTFVRFLLSRSIRLYFPFFFYEILIDVQIGQFS